MAEMEWWVIGFDLRSIPKEQKQPCSVDSEIWKSVIEVDDPGLPLSEWMGPRHDHWENLNHLETYVENHAHHKLSSSWVIASAQIREELEASEPDMCAHTLVSSVPLTPSDRWTLLGYDVADYLLVSGLYNCGPLPEAEILAQLNEYGLFGELENAVLFEKRCNVRFESRRPFFVYAVYRVREFEAIL